MVGLFWTEKDRLGSHLMTSVWAASNLNTAWHRLRDRGSDTADEGSVCVCLVQHVFASSSRTSFADSTLSTNVLYRGRGQVELNECRKDLPMWRTVSGHSHELTSTHTAAGRTTCLFGVPGAAREDAYDAHLTRSNVLPPKLLNCSVHSDALLLLVASCYY